MKNGGVIIDGWVARDENGDLYAYIERPTKRKTCWNAPSQCMMLDENLYPEVQWEDEEPKEVALIIAEKEFVEYGTETNL